MRNGLRHTPAPTDRSPMVSYPCALALRLACRIWWLALDISASFLSAWISGANPLHLNADTNLDYPPLPTTIVLETEAVAESKGNDRPRKPSEVT